MNLERIYFNKKYDQWKSKILFNEDEIGDFNLYIQLMDVDLIRGNLNCVYAYFKNIKLETFAITCDVEDYNKNIIKLKLPPQVLSNKGVYELVISISFIKGNLIKSSIQKFEIDKTIEINDDELTMQTNYPILDSLIKELSRYKIDLSTLITLKQAESIINNKIQENLNNTTDRDAIVLYNRDGIGYEFIILDNGLLKYHGMIDG